ncbi:hypothetical protein T06_14594 [Trichinella sp. T6]|nr:hypothetical protein T06_14594 [Trichinella sp. T6]
MQCLIDCLRNLCDISASCDLLAQRTHASCKANRSSKCFEWLRYYNFECHQIKDRKNTMVTFACALWLLRSS